MEHPAPNALALTFAGFSIGMDGHDRAAAFAAFEAALAVSPSSISLAASFSHFPEKPSVRSNGASEGCA
jgi:hypothetical protein